MDGGNLQAQGTQRAIPFVNFVPVNVLLADTTPPYHAGLVERDIRPAGGSVNNFLVEDATLDNFVNNRVSGVYGVDGGFRVTYIGELKQNADALAFIGHAVPANGVAPAQSAGLMLFDADLIKRGRI